MPGFFTEELLDDEADELGGRRAFLDIIHNQIYPLLYRAWLKYRLGHQVVEFENPKYTEMIFSLVGLGEDFRNEPEKYGYLLEYAGLLSQRTKSLSGLKTILRGYLGEIDIKPCVRRKVPIVKQQRCLLGQQHATIGDDACVGKEVDDRGGKFIIEIGPLDARRFAEMAAAGKKVAWIKNLLELYLVQPLEFGITLLLEPGAVRPAEIGDPERSVLGSNCWLVGSPNEEIDRVELPVGSIRKSQP